MSTAQERLEGNKRMYIPPGFNTVTPYFFIEKAEDFAKFLVGGLGGVETGRTMRPDGAISNVPVKLGTSTVMVSEATERCKAIPPRTTFMLTTCMPR
jgi:PhnB protein